MSEEITAEPTPRARKVRYLIAAVFLVAIAVCFGFWNGGRTVLTRNEYQQEFARRFSVYLDRVQVRSADAEKKVTDDPQYQKLYQRYTQLSEQAEGQAKEIRAKLDQVNKDLAPLLKIFREFQNPSVGQINYEEMEKKYIPLKQQKDELTAQLDALMKPSKEALEEVNAFTAARLTELPPEKWEQLKTKYANGKPNEAQHSVATAKNGDQCETCHLGVALTGVELTPASMSLPGQKPDKYARAFVTHPKPELLQIHDPAKFGCTLCHGGNGRETTSVERAHGTYASWPKPLYPKGYMEIGCQTCHASDMTLAGRTDLAPLLNQAKAMFRQGCVACHQLAGFEDEREDLKLVANQIHTLTQQKESNLRQAALKEDHAKVAPTDENARALLQEAKNLKAENNRIDIELEQLNQRTRDLLRERKRVAHNFKEIRNKLYPNWIPFFVHGPGRPLGPTVPSDEDIRAMAAYVWQTAIPDAIPKQPPGNPVKGKELLETRGCLGCHPVSANPPSSPNPSGPTTLSLIGDPPLIGTFFAIPLSRVGERDKYDYLVRWIQNPKQRLRPYCLLEKRDIGPEDYARHGLPFIFDAEHDRCPNDGQLLQVQQETVMPNLRLTLEESRDIASYLITLKTKDPNTFPEASLDDPKLKAKGQVLIGHHGCAGCHEIAGFETQEPIGPDLTNIGSKPVDQLDFGPLRKMAQQGIEPISHFENRERLPGGPAKGPWYTLKDFIERKLAEPNLFDLGTTKGPMEQLRMPNTRLTPDQVRALTVLLLGSQKMDLPSDYIYRPANAADVDIQRGWNVVRKYNCMGCHQILPGQQTPLMNMPLYREHPEQLPPTLVTLGAKVNPEWLARYLKNPAMSNSDIHRNGVRQYLKIRMPTFSFSDNEIGILVRFFQALAHQSPVYIPQTISASTPKETETARKLWSNPELACLTCHSSGDPVRQKYAIAPDLLLARDRLNPGWLERWISEPHEISPGCVMPSGFFENVAMNPPATMGAREDLAKMLARYIIELTPPEQRKLMNARLERARQRPQRQPAYQTISSSRR